MKRIHNLLLSSFLLFFSLSLSICMENNLFNHETAIKNNETQDQISIKTNYITNNSSSSPFFNIINVFLPNGNIRESWSCKDNCETKTWTLWWRK